MDYRQLVDGLQIPEAFFQEHRDVIYERLVNAADVLTGSPGEFYSPEEMGINRSLHLATSFLLSGSTADRVSVVSQGIRAYSRRDPNTVLAVATLGYLLDRTEEGHPDTKAKMQCLRDLFGRYKWMVDEETISALGLNRATQEQSQ